jgi:predicted transcriptional regulator
MVERDDLVMCVLRGSFRFIVACRLVDIYYAERFSSRTFISGAPIFSGVVAVLPELKEIRSRRKMLGLTQGELAEAGGLSRTSLSKLENGLADLGYGKVKRLFDVLERVERERALALGLEGVSLEGVHSVPVEYVEAGVVLGDVWARMVERGFSQFPVRREGVVVGCVTERMVNRMVFDRGFEEAVAMRVEEIMGPPFPVLDVRAPVRLAIPLLQVGKGVLTSREGIVTGIVTNSDIGKGFR